MKACSRARRLLPLAVTEDLPRPKQAFVQAHLVDCAACRVEEEKFRTIILSARSQDRAEYQLPDWIRARITREAVDRVLRGRAPWSVPMPFLAYQARTILVGAVATLCLALAILPFLQRLATPPEGQAEARAIRVVAEGGVVRLAWSDGEKASYTVYKTTDPRHPNSGEVHVVKGRRSWTDTDPGSSPIVFYRIE